MRFVLILASLLLVPVCASAELAATLVDKATAYGSVSYPQLSGLTDKTIEQNINTMIAEEAAKWTCVEGDFAAGRREHGSYNATTTLRLIDNRYLSYTTEFDFYYGGAYPSNYMTSSNFDLETSGAVPLSKLLVPEMQGAALTKFLIAGHESEQACMDDDGQISIAETYNPDEFNAWDYYRTKDQIVFIPRLPHVAAACFRTFPVSLEQIKNYLQP